MSFIHNPAIDGIMNIDVEWNLSSTPSGTRAACSLGEGKKITTQAEAAVLDECFFAVGSLRSYPSGEAGELWYVLFRESTF